MRYVGSKAKIAKYIVPIIQSFVDKSDKKIYIEPFVGGANIIDKINACFRIGNDLDPLVIDLYSSVIENISLLEKLPVQVSKELYYDVRENPNKYEKWFRSAILLFASYNARVYGGCYGAETKTKEGKIRNYYRESLENFKRQLPRLSQIIWLNFDYRDIKGLKCGGNVIYCDPPYAEGIGYKVGFNHDEFWQWCREMSKNNIVLVSETKAPSDFKCIWSMPIKCHMNNRKKIDRVEKLFLYKDGYGCRY